MGIIGINGIGRTHIRLAQQNDQVKLTALADTDESSLRKQAARLKVRGFHDYREMLAAGDLDLVTIATPHGLHAQMGMDCLEAGLHILVEKPLATQIGEAEALVKIARTRNLRIAVGHQYRFHRSSKAVKKLLDERSIGEVQRVLWTWVALRKDRYYRDKPWKGSWQQAGGGVVMNQASHDLDLLCWFIGPAMSVTALMGNQAHDSEVEDIISASVRFANGAMASLQFSINHPHAYSVRQLDGERGAIVFPDVRSLTRDAADRVLLGTYPQPLAEAIASDAIPPATRWQAVKLPRLKLGASYRSVQLLEHVIPKPVLRRWDREISRRLLNRDPIMLRRGLFTAPINAYATLFDDFLAAIRDGRESAVSGESSLPALELINAIILSAAKRKTIDLPLDRDEYREFYGKQVGIERSLTRLT
jgi:predicted dehydrogenase